MPNVLFHYKGLREKTHKVYPIIQKKGYKATQQNLNNVYITTK